jgi:hypothetical protein
MYGFGAQVLVSHDFGKPNAFCQKSRGSFYSAEIYATVL